SYAPYLVKAHDIFDDPGALSYTFLEGGRKIYHPLLQHYAWCVEHDIWEGYSTEHADMMLPPWAEKQISDKISG
ncbi:hypothetical protein LCGC14_2206960, partial [marine sediment metagenome]